LKVRLKGAAAKTLECSYAATFVDGSEIGPVSGGETCEAESLAALESFRITLHPRDGKVVARPNPVAKAPTGDKPTGTKPAGTKPAGVKPTGAKPTADKPAANTTKMAPRTRAGT
jgi:hypothetical protein